MKVNKFYLLILIYFFFNSVGLPHGLLYTTLLTPLFIYWLVKKSQTKLILRYFIFTGPYVIIHSILGIDFSSFLKSYSLLFATYIFMITFYIKLKEKQDLGKQFKQLLLLNFCFTIIAIILYFTPLQLYAWTVRNLTLTIQNFPRLQLLTYEPSYYSTLLSPIVIFYGLKLLIEKREIKQSIAYILLILLPLTLSFSLGVISALLISLFLVILKYQKLFFGKTVLFHSIVSIVIVGIITLFLLAIFYPDNPLFRRIIDIIFGYDLSAKGRTTEAIKLSFLVADTKSSLFGVGVGQIKIMGDVVVRTYYNYHAADIPIIRIPSAIGETIGTFGITGLVLRLFIELYLMVKTKVFDNLYRASIFIYIFIYQFTGSYLTNIAEYVLWVIAFTPAFYQFEISRIKQLKD